MGREGKGGGIVCLRQEQPVRRSQVNSTNGKVEEMGGGGKEDSVFETRATCLETTGKLNQWEGRGGGIMCLKQEQHVWRPQVNSTNGKVEEGGGGGFCV